MKIWSVLGLGVFASAIMLSYFAEDSFAKSRYYGKDLCKKDGFYCVTVKRGDTWAKLFSNKRERELVMRLNRTNIALYYRKWIVVPQHLSSISLMDVTPFSYQIKPRSGKLVLIDLKKHAFAAYNANGKQVRWGPISGGKGWCTDVGKPCHTVIGRFKVERKQQQECISKTFPLPDGGAEMPYCMFFHGGYAMHAGQLPGFNDSHGCVRMVYEDAKWLNLNFIDVGIGGTEVIVIR